MTEPLNFDDYPETIDFHLPEHPEPVTLVYDDDRLLFRQLVCWCMIQRYRYYVLSKPLVTDMEYDYVEKYVLQMRSEADYLADMYCPLTKPGSSRREDYPAFIRASFSTEKSD